MSSARFSFVSDEEKKLEMEATRILREAGLAWDGRAAGRTSGAQFAFERRMIKVATRGKSRRKV